MSLRRLLDSPTAMTSASLGMRLGGAFIILGAVLGTLPEASVSLWLLLRTIVGLRIIGDLGFGNTLVRAIAYAMGGATDLERPAPKSTPQKPQATNWQMLGEICGTMEIIYRRIALIAGGFLLLVVTPLMVRPIALLDDPTVGWWSWAAVLSTLPVVFRGNAYQTFLVGTDHVALVRRWEAATSLGNLLSAITVLYLGGGLLMLVVATQAWEVINVARNYWLAHTILDGRLRSLRRHPYSPKVFASVWSRAWRSGSAVLLTTGANQSSGLIYAQIGDAGAVASYLIALRLYDAANQFSTAPFYSRLPQMARLHAEGRRADLVGLARARMAGSLWLLTAVLLAVGVSGPALLRLLGSEVTFVPTSLWAILALAAFGERYGSMHLQLYTTTNHVLWHKISAVYAAIFLTVSFALVGRIGVFAFPVAMLGGYAGFFAWYSARLSHRAFRLGLWSFEGRAMAPQLMLLAVGLAIILGW